MSFCVWTKFRQRDNECLVLIRPLNNHAILVFHFSSSAALIAAFTSFSRYLLASSPSFPAAVTLSPSLGMCASCLPHAALQAHAQQLLRFHRELHWQLAEDFLAETIHDHVDRVLR